MTKFLDPSGTLKAIRWWTLILLVWMILVFGFAVLLEVHGAGWTDNMVRTITCLSLLPAERSLWNRLGPDAWFRTGNSIGVQVIAIFLILVAWVASGAFPLPIMHRYVIQPMEPGHAHIARITGTVVLAIIWIACFIARLRSVSRSLAGSLESNQVPAGS